MSRILLPLVPLYGMAIALKNAAYDREWITPKRLRWPVVSVGNLSVGGSGKTPLVIALAKLLTREGVHVDVLSRGYGRSSKATERVDVAGDAARFGDEPLLIAQSTQAPVYVGANRYEAGLLAESENMEPGVHLLDDGFQHRKLARDVDIAVIHRSDLQGHVLPAGRLRESLQALQRASVLVVREEDAEVEDQLRDRGIRKPIWRIRRVLTVPSESRRVLAFCGIARPDEYFQALQKQHVEVATKENFRDHHNYSESDMRQLIAKLRSVNAEAFLTTEKDFTRMQPEQKKLLADAAPLLLARLEVVFQDEAAVLSGLKEMLPAAFRRSL
ncbi:MAG TPA: tetraacyldisaccharide 4'-kinase [Alloacidobacterium sp.]|nr:tetraacyldisaccharide 4'-kinase [Alloacidobacterium sp.]